MPTHYTEEQRKQRAAAVALANALPGGRVLQDIIEQVKGQSTTAGKVGAGVRGVLGAGANAVDTTLVQPIVGSAKTIGESALDFGQGLFGITPSTAPTTSIVPTATPVTAPTTTTTTPQTATPVRAPATIRSFNNLGQGAGVRGNPGIFVQNDPVPTTAQQNYIDANSKIAGNLQQNNPSLGAIQREIERASGLGANPEKSLSDEIADLRARFPIVRASADSPYPGAILDKGFGPEAMAALINQRSGQAGNLEQERLRGEYGIKQAGVSKAPGPLTPTQQLQTDILELSKDIENPNLNAGAKAALIAQRDEQLRILRSFGNFGATEVKADSAEHLQNIKTLSESDATGTTKNALARYTAILDAGGDIKTAIANALAPPE